MVEDGIPPSLAPFVYGVLVGIFCVALLVPAPSRPTTVAAEIGGGSVPPAPVAPVTPPPPAAVELTASTSALRPTPPKNVSQTQTEPQRQAVPQRQVVPQRPAVPQRPTAPKRQALSQPPAVPSDDATETDFRGSLEVRSSPQGAHVFLNGVPVGTTPVLLRDMPVGSRALRVELDGYNHWSSTVQIMAKEQTRIMATLPSSLAP